MIGAARAGISRSYNVLSTTDITSVGTQTYTIPAGTLYVEIEMMGGGGGGGMGGSLASGGKNVTFYGAQGGGGGGYLKHRYYGNGDMQANDVLEFEVGTGGAGGILNSDGGSGFLTKLIAHKRGGNTIYTFSPQPISYGGIGGGGFSTIGVFDGSGGGATNGNVFNSSGGNGLAGRGGVLNGASWGGTGGGDGNGTRDGLGGDVTNAGGFGNTTPGNGSQPGGGGGGAGAGPLSSPSGGTGGAGQVRVVAYG